MILSQYHIFELDTINIYSEFSGSLEEKNAEIRKSDEHIWFSLGGSNLGKIAKAAIENGSLIVA